MNYNKYLRSTAHKSITLKLLMVFILLVQTYSAFIIYKIRDDQQEKMQWVRFSIKVASYMLLLCIFLCLIILTIYYLPNSKTVLVTSDAQPSAQELQNEDIARYIAICQETSQVRFEKQKEYTEKLRLAQAKSQHIFPELIKFTPLLDNHPDLAKYTQLEATLIRQYQQIKALNLTLSEDPTHISVSNNEKRLREERIRKIGVAIQMLKRASLNFIPIVIVEPVRRWLTTEELQAAKIRCDIQQAFLQPLYSLQHYKNYIDTVDAIRPINMAMSSENATLKHAHHLKACNDVIIEQQKRQRQVH